MANILITDGIERNAACYLIDKGYELVEQYYPADELKEIIKDFDAVVIRSATKITKDIIDGALITKRLKLIIRGGVGVDNIDVQYANDNGIIVMNTPNSSSLAVAELAIGHMFALARYIYISNVTMRNGLWEKKKYKGIELNGKSLGIIGFGRIARETARLAKAIGMNVIYYTRSGKKEGFDDYKYVSLDQLLRNSDFLSLHIPFDKNTGPFIKKEQFDLMKSGVYLINCSRGGVVDEEALIEALNSGKVAAAAIDVFKEEPTKNERLYTNEKVCITPHIGASTKEAQEKIGKEIVNIIESQLRQEG
jgi:D-3-phosphoglycerate dehydrogenase / 2-oxoglutarate reductase